MEWFIKIYRQIETWEWYTDSEVKCLFIHLLIKANHKKNKWRWITIEKWQLITSYNKLSIETWLSVRNIRTALKKLESTWEVTHKTTNKYSILELNNYDTYNSKWQTKSHSSDNPVTTNNNKDNKDNINNIFTHWNSKWVTNHKKVTSDIKLQIEARLKEYSEDDIIKAIDNYSDIYLSDECWFSYKWPLAAFLQRKNGMREFLYKSKEDYYNDDVKKNKTQKKSFEKDDEPDFTDWL